MYIEMPFSDCISDTYQSTGAIRKRHIIAVLHISKPWKWKKQIEPEALKSLYRSPGYKKKPIGPM